MEPDERFLAHPPMLAMSAGSSKCVEITEAMALHEIAAYPKTFPQLSCEASVPTGDDPF